MENKKGKALRYNSGKLELDSIPWNAVSAFCAVCSVNSSRHGGKYPNGNYRLGAPQSQYFDCGLRHYIKHAMGHRIDPTDGLPHAWKAMWNFMMAVEDGIVHPENDDLELNIPIDFEIFTKYVQEQEIKRKKIKEKEEPVNSESPSEEYSLITPSSSAKDLIVEKDYASEKHTSNIGPYCSITFNRIPDRNDLSED